MKTMQWLSRMIIVLGILVLVAMAFSALALADISRAEADLNLEWATLRITALLMLMFVGLTFSYVRKLSSRMDDA